jgi:CDP-archaeol synthase
VHLDAVLELLVLLALANGTPVVAKKIFGRHFARPLDGGARFIDGRPLFGRSKTIRGIVLSIVVTALCAPVLGLSVRVGALAAAAAMTGDLLSSFVKRRMGRATSSRALGLDQIFEALFPALSCRDALGLGAADIALALALFFVGEIVLSRLLYRVNLRDEPY